MSILKEFREFAIKGNVMDMAVGIMIGTAFNKVVTSVVADLVTPPLGLVLGKVNFASLFVTLGPGDYPSLEAAKEAGAPTLNYGAFLQSAMDFVIVAAVLFFVVRAINRLKRKEEVGPAPSPTTRDCPECLSSIPLKATRCAFCTASVAA